MTRRSDRILLAHGSGGRLTHELISDTFLPALANPILAPLSDAAVLPDLPPGRPAFTTDGFVVDPPDFPGGNLGHLSICGTVNDLAMSGARPLWLSWALILEEGVELTLVEACAKGAAEAAAEAGVQVAAGDTKVVPRGKGDRIYAVTAGIGVVPPGRDVADRRIRTGDAILVSGPIADHGATIMACRHDLVGEGLLSDCGPVNGLVEALYEAGVDVHCLHDPTRGGVLAVCNETADRAGVRLVLDEVAIPVRPQVAAVCDLLGLDPLAMACEGRLLGWVAADQVDIALSALHSLPEGAGAAVIGHVEEQKQGEVPVVMQTSVGGLRPLDLLSGSDLPRIC